MFYNKHMRIEMTSQRYEQCPRLYFFDRRQLPTLLNKLSTFPATTVDQGTLYTSLWPFIWSCFPEFIGHPNDVLSQKRIVDAFTHALNTNQAGIITLHYIVLFLC